jgi:small subunit ribosomal protein S1
MSTDNFLEKDLSELMDADFDLLDEQISNHTTREQSVVKGRVLEITDERVLIDINYKAEGYVPLSDFIDENGEVSVKVGDEVEVFLEYVNQNDGCSELSKKKADEMKAWESIAQKFENNEIIRGLITHRVKGGLSVDIGVKAFLPGSQVNLRPVKNLEQLLDRELDFRIIKFNQKRGNIVLSRRALLEEKRRLDRAETLKRLEVGNVMTGKVKNITDYGVFIDLGGIDGLLHITDMTYARINHPNEMVKKDDEIQVKILKYDVESQRVSLGHKQIYPNPWDNVETRYPLNCIVKGTVVNIEKYGIFVELEKGIEGLIHHSEMSWNSRFRENDVAYQIGDEVEALVKEIDLKEERISLSIKEITSNPWDGIDIRYPVGSVITGVVKNIADYGIFLEIEDGIDGLVHVSDLFWSKRDKRPNEVFQKGDKVSAKIKDIDMEKQRFSLSIKEVTEDPWLSVQSRYFLGQVVDGQVVSHVDYGIFVEIEDGVDGLIHSADLVKATKDSKKTDLRTLYPFGTDIKVEILRIDVDRRIMLAEKGDNTGTANADDFIAQGNSSMNLNDVLDDLSTDEDKD